MKEKFSEKETMFKKKITMLEQKIEDIELEVKESTNNLSIAIETAPKADDVYYDHLDN